MARSIWTGQSIYWNPYSGTGSLGPETLVDIKTSPLSIAVALMGGSDLAFHLAFLGLNFLGVFCLLVLVHRRAAFVTAGGDRGRLSPTC